MIVHPEALADWRANDERPHKINTGESYAINNNTLPKKQTKLEGLLALRLKEAIERENRKRGTVRKEGEA
jgi:hypothetical protein